MTNIMLSDFLFSLHQILVLPRVQTHTVVVALGFFIVTPCRGQRLGNTFKLTHDMRCVTARVIIIRGH